MKAERVGNTVTTRISIALGFLLALAAAVERGDLREVERAAHILVSSSGTLAAYDVAEAAKAVQAAAAQGGLGLAERLEEFQALFSALVVRLRSES